MEVIFGLDLSGKPLRQTESLLKKSEERFLRGIIASSMTGSSRLGSNPRTMDIAGPSEHQK